MARENRPQGPIPGSAVLPERFRVDEHSTAAHENARGKNKQKLRGVGCTRAKRRSPNYLYHFPAALE